MTKEGLQTQADLFASEGIGDRARRTESWRALKAVDGEKDSGK